MIKDKVLKLRDELKLYEDMAFRKARVKMGISLDSPHVINERVQFSDSGIRVTLFNTKYLDTDYYYLTWEEFKLSDKVLLENVVAENCKENYKENYGLPSQNS